MIDETVPHAGEAVIVTSRPLIPQHVPTQERLEAMTDLRERMRAAGQMTRAARANKEEARHLRNLALVALHRNYTTTNPRTGRVRPKWSKQDCVRLVDMNRLDFTKAIDHAPQLLEYGTESDTLAEVHRHHSKYLEQRSIEETARLIRDPLIHRAHAGEFGRDLAANMAAIGAEVGIAGERVAQILNPNYREQREQARRVRTGMHEPPE